MAYRVRYPNQPAHIPFLLFSFLTSFSSGYTKDTSYLILPDNPGVAAASPPPRPDADEARRNQRVPWIFESPRASKMPPRWAKRQLDTYMITQDASKTSQGASKTAQEASQTALRRVKTVFLSQHGPMLAPTWSHVGTKIAFRRYLMLKQFES